LSNSFNRQISTHRYNRSVSFDYRDSKGLLDSFGDDFAELRRQFALNLSVNINPEEASDDSQEIGTYHSNNASPRRCSSPVFSYGPRSPLGTYFPIFNLEDLHEEKTMDEGMGTDLQEERNGRLSFISQSKLVNRNSISEEGEENEEQDSPATTSGGTSNSVPPEILQSISPPSLGRFPPSHNRQSITSSTNDKFGLKSTPVDIQTDLQRELRGQPIPPAPATNLTRRYVPPHMRQGYVKRESTEISILVSASLEIEAPILNDPDSFLRGDTTHGVTSLLGKRKNLEDVCCCLPDYNSYLNISYEHPQAMYAVFDGHCGIQVFTLLFLIYYFWTYADNSLGCTILFR